MVLAFAAMIAFASCSVIQPLPKKDASMQIAKQDLRQSVKELYTNIKLGSKNYVSWATQYAYIDSLAAAIKTLDEQRNHSKNYVRQDVLFITAFSNYEQWHKGHALTSADANVYMKSMDGLAKPMLISEIKLKH